MLGITAFVSIIVCSLALARNKKVAPSGDLVKRQLDVSISMATEDSVPSGGPSSSGGYFRLESYNYVVYNTPLPPAEFSAAIRRLNPILEKLQTGIHWSCLTAGDDSKFEGINFQPGSDISTLSWVDNNQVGQSRDGIAVYHQFEIEITLKTGRQTDLKSDMELIYAAEWELKQAMRTDILLPEKTVFNFIYNGRTDVKIFTMDGQGIGFFGKGTWVLCGKCTVNSAFADLVKRCSLVKMT